MEKLLVERVLLAGVVAEKALLLVGVGKGELLVEAKE